MRVGLALVDVWSGTDGNASHWAELRGVVDLARDSGFDMISLGHRWLGSPHWNLQPFAAAAYLSAATGEMHMAVRDLRLALTNPVEVAEQIATLDHACEGRLTISATTAPNVIELEAFGADPGDVLERTTEALDVMQAVWAQERVTHRGRFWTITDGRPTLRPLQSPSPPVSLHVANETEARFAAQHGCGLHVGADVPDDGLPTILDAHGEEAARVGSQRFGHRRSLSRRWSAADATDRWLESMAAYEDLGVDEVELWPGTLEDRGGRPLIDEIATATDRLLPALGRRGGV